ncbi:hypothetical protein OK016_17010 [Vibrio chagasii]|nr:hypothetical protein [Vibrio chagasii]
MNNATLCCWLDEAVTGFLFWRVGSDAIVLLTSVVRLVQCAYAVINSVVKRLQAVFKRTRHEHDLQDDSLAAVTGLRNWRPCRARTVQLRGSLPESVGR